MRLLTLLGLAFVVTGFLIQLEQYIIWRHWFDFGQIHHESFAMAAWGMAIVFFAVSFMKRPKQQVQVSKL